MKKIAFVIYQIHKCAQGHVTLQQLPTPHPSNIVILTRLTNSSGCISLIRALQREWVRHTHRQQGWEKEVGYTASSIHPCLLTMFTDSYPVFATLKILFCLYSPTSFNIAQFYFISSSYLFVILFYFLLFIKKQTLQ